ncbi:MAG TPA: TIGR00730 family Rossman fold protein [Burkholderiales bacterium]|nr:TIGR00730 family Rossman fold protein [Burkholderiales bacterium]
MASARYLEADRDPRFLQHDETRGVRLELEYLKAERRLEAHDVRHTILVLGSTRIGSRPAARTRGYYAVARELGRLVARAGRRHGGALMTGGGPGLMAAANRGAAEAGGVSIGLNISLPRRQRPNRYLTPGLCLTFRYFALRKLHFLLRARALVAFPGGFGTFDELFEALTLVQTRKIRPMPIVLAGEAYWRQAFDMDFLVAQGVVSAGDRRLFAYADTAPDIWRAVRRWYRKAGEPVFPPARTRRTGE